MSAKITLFGYNIDSKIPIALALMTVFVLVGGGIFYALEGGTAIASKTGQIETWDYLNCVYFCVVTLTTIGFGDFYPTTSGSKAFLIIYSLCGLALIGFSVTMLAQKFIKRAAPHIKARIKAQKQAAASSTADIQAFNPWWDRFAMFFNHYARMFTAWAVFLVMWFGGAGIFAGIEGWAYTDGIYFCYITLTTIGYGDIVPQTTAGRIIMIFYAFTGFGFLGFILAEVGKRFYEVADIKARKEKVQNLRKVIPEDASIPLHLLKLAAQLDKLSNQEDISVIRAYLDRVQHTITEQQLP